MGAFGIVWLPYGTRCKTGLTSAKVRAMKSRQNFSQGTHSIHPIGPKTDVLVCFVLFGCILDRLVALRNSVQNGPNKCKSSCHEVASEFFARNTPDTSHWTLKLRFGALLTIWLPYETRCKMGRNSAKFRATKSRRNFSQQQHPIQPIRP